jgi:WD40 repeat protein
VRSVLGLGVVSVGLAALSPLAAQESKAPALPTPRSRMIQDGIVWCMAFSPDGKTLASAGQGKTITLWDVRTGKERATLTEHTNWGMTSVAFSPDGKTLATASGHYQSANRWRGTIKLWDVPTD